MIVSLRLKNMLVLNHDYNKKSPGIRKVCTGLLECLCSINQGSDSIR